MHTQKRFGWVYIPPLIHLVICLTAMSGYLVPRLQFLGILWSVITIVDLPVSLVTVALVWKHEVLAGVWAVLAGTWWWYFLSRKLESLLNRSKRHEGSPSGT